MRRNTGRKPLLIAMAITLVGTLIAYAGVVGYNYLNVTVGAEKPPVIFTAGSNAGQPGIGGTIKVSFDVNETVAFVEFNVSNGTYYVFDPVRVKNRDVNSYFIALSVTDTTPFSSFQVAELYLYDEVNAKYVAVLDLKTNTFNVTSLEIPAGTEYQVVFKLVPDPNLWKVGDSIAFTVEIAWSTNAADLARTPP